MRILSPILFLAVRRFGCVTSLGWLHQAPVAILVGTCFTGFVLGNENSSHLVYWSVEQPYLWKVLKLISQRVCAIYCPSHLEDKGCLTLDPLTNHTDCRIILYAQATLNLLYVHFVSVCQSIYRSIDLYYIVCIWNGHICRRILKTANQRLGNKRHASVHAGHVIAISL